MSNLESVVAMLGLPRRVRTAVEMRSRVRKGFPYSTIERVARDLELSVVDTAIGIGLKPRTIARRKEEKVLDPIESERVLRVARVFTRAVEVLGAEEKARRWIHKPNRALGGESPLAMLDTDLGTQAAEDALTRIEHGVFS